MGRRKVAERRSECSRMRKYGRTGWFGESHRHYLASKGVKTASKHDWNYRAKKEGPYGETIFVEPNVDSSEGFTARTALKDGTWGITFGKTEEEALENARKELFHNSRKYAAGKFNFTEPGTQVRPAQEFTRTTIVGDKKVKESVTKGKDPYVLETENVDVGTDKDVVEYEGYPVQLKKNPGRTRDSFDTLGALDKSYKDELMDEYAEYGEPAKWKVKRVAAKAARETVYEAKKKKRGYYAYTPAFVAGDMSLIAADGVGTAGAAVVPWIPVAVPLVLAYGGAKYMTNRKKKTGSYFAHKQDKGLPPYERDRNKYIPEITLDSSKQFRLVEKKLRGKDKKVSPEARLALTSAQARAAIQATDKELPRARRAELKAIARLKIPEAR